MLTKDIVLSLLEYDKSSGIFKWKESRGGYAKKGMVAGGVDSKGYVQIKINRKLYLAHRLVWLVEFGQFPKMHIDHVDRNPKNNAIQNLRLCTRFENQQNVGVRKTNTSGHVGVSYVKRSNKWLSYISVNKKTVRLGLFESIGDAVDARTNAKSKFHTFHPYQ